MGLGLGKLKRRLKKHLKFTTSTGELKRRVKRDLKSTARDIKRIGRDYDKEFLQKLKHGVEEVYSGAGDVVESGWGMIPPEQQEPPEQKILPMPDSEMSYTARRKQRARQRSGRSDSILSDSETLG